MTTASRRPASPSLASGSWGQDRIDLALEAGGIGTWEWDRRTDRVRWDERLERLYGLAPGTFGGHFEDWVAQLHPDDRDGVLAAVEQSLAQGSSHDVEHRIVRPDGQVRWIHGRGEVLHDDAGEVVGLVGVGQDITARREAEAERARLLEVERQARQRLQFLAKASEVLVQSLDTDATLQDLADLAVPSLADWCAIELNSTSGIQTLAIAHRDPDKVAVAKRLHREYRVSSELGAGRVLQSGEPEIYPEISDDLLRQAGRDDRHLELLRQLEARSALVLPLRGHETTLGALILVHAESGRRYGHEDLAFAQELAARAAVAIDNARLYESRVHVAQVLQQSLLPPALPHVPGCDLAAHYEPSARGWDIGGDFYDVFENPDRSWTVLIGDVRGKGPEAATMTGLVRHTVRAAALRDPAPAHVLSVLNEALIQHDPHESFCTAIVGVLRSTDAEVSVRLTTAGHPAATVVRAEGEVRPCAAGGLLVGLFENLDVVTDEVSLRPGDALVLHTDGVTEARRREDMFGVRRMHRTLREHAGGSAQQLVDGLVDAVRRFRGDEGRDDTAILAVRADA